MPSAGSQAGGTTRTDAEGGDGDVGGREDYGKMGWDQMKLVNQIWP